MIDKLSHIDEKGHARMVDVSGKEYTARVAVAEGFITMQEDTQKLIMSGQLPKGDVIATARLAGIMAAKKTSDVIPLCHPLPISGVKVNIEPHGNDQMRVEARVKVSGQTGVEMEALHAVSTALLTLYDMAKAVDKAMTIKDIRLLLKEGGKSGTYKVDNS